MARNDAKDGLVFVLGAGGADVSAVVPAIQLALGKLSSKGAEAVEAVSAAAAEASPPPPRPNAAAAGGAADKEALERAVKAEFTRLVKEEGIAPNEAAVAAITNVRRKMAAGDTTKDVR